jgi:hypothetical protein
MKVGEIKNLLWDIAKRYPRFQGLLKRQVGNETQGTIWANDLAAMNLDGGFLQDVCDDYASMRRDLPDPIDNLVKEIADEVRFKKYQEQRRLELHLQAHRPKAGELMNTVKDFRIGKAAIDMGVAVRNGSITVEQNDLWLEQLIGWDNGENDLPPNVVVNDKGKVIFSIEG